MKYSELTHGKQTNLELTFKTIPDELPRSGDDVSLKLGDNEAEVRIKTRSGTLIATPKTQPSQEQLNKLFDGGCYRLCRVLVASKERLIIAVHEFPEELHLPEALRIGIDEKVIDLARNKRKAYTSVEEVVNWLNEEVVLSGNHSDDEYVFLTGTPGNQRKLAGAFRLMGQSVSVDVKTDAEGRLKVERVVYTQNNPVAEDARSIHLVRGNIRFVDGTLAQEFRGLAKDLIDQVIKDGDSYLDLWRRYNSVEREINLRKAREFGIYHYDSFRTLPEGEYEFTLAETTEFESMPIKDEMGDIYLEAALHPPADFSTSDAAEKPSQNRRQRNFTGAPVSVHGRKVVLNSVDEDPTKPPDKGVLFLSIRGDEIRLNRREAAHKRIINGTSPMPQLGLILEGRHTPERRGKIEKAISPAAKDAFRGEPTPRQIEALDAALNAPDITLIQGPPRNGQNTGNRCLADAPCGNPWRPFSRGGTHSPYQLSTRCRRKCGRSNGDLRFTRD